MITKELYGSIRGKQLKSEENTVTGKPRRWFSLRAFTGSAEYAIRFFLAAMLAGANIFGSYAPFGLGMVAASGAGLDGFCALVGACFGYLAFQGFSSGLPYVAASILIYSVSFAFYDIRVYRNALFMPLTAATLNAATQFVYLGLSGWAVEQVIFFCMECMLVALSAYLYAGAFSQWKTKGDLAVTPQQLVSFLFFLGTLLISLAGISLPFDISPGRLAAALIVLTTAWAGGAGLGAAVGITAGLGMDVATSGTFFYCAAYGLSGLLTGVMHKQGRSYAALTFAVSDAAAVLWTWDNGLRISILYEVALAVAVFLLLPSSLLRRVTPFFSREQAEESGTRMRAYVQERLSSTAGAFRSLYESIRSAFHTADLNDNDSSVLFDRAAERVCIRCALRDSCWQREYNATFNALNDTLPTLLDRGRGEQSDFPDYFRNRCLHFPAFLQAVNEELTALLQRRQWTSRLHESRAAVCRQYAQLSGILGDAVEEFSTQLVADTAKGQQLNRYLAAIGVDGTSVVFFDEHGHLRAEIAGGDLSLLHTREVKKKLSRLLGCPLHRPVSEDDGHRVVFTQAEPLMAVAGVSAQRKDGETVSGDTGQWFKHTDGKLYILLCDGMGSGEGARMESSLAVTLLEQFLRAGISPEDAIRTLNSALSLRSEAGGGFTTIDLLQVDLFTGNGRLYKLGAAPTYIKHGGNVTRLSGNSLPAGLADGTNFEPDVSSVSLSDGDLAVLVSDGISGSDDNWIRMAVASFEGDSPRTLANQLVERSIQSGDGATDDRTAVVVKLLSRPKDGSAPRRQKEPAELSS
ncbi:MAG: stage sporulation protein [Oscillospiraceae bacterium]|nr:stage sporulation protein [Oscillospiraceae bacterium]